MPTYDEIKAELSEIASILDKFPESVQPKVFDVLIDNYVGVATIPSETRPMKPRSKQARKKEAEIDEAKKRRPPAKAFSVLDIDLGGGDGIRSFKDFCEEKKPETNVQFNVVAVYYLEKVMGLSEITPNHVYTCYSWMRRKPTRNFMQNLRDTSRSRNPYIDTSNWDNIKMQHLGNVVVEHDLPKESKKKS